MHRKLIVEKEKMDGGGREGSGGQSNSQWRTKWKKKEARLRNEKESVSLENRHDGMDDDFLRPEAPKQAKKQSHLSMD